MYWNLSLLFLTVFCIVEVYPRLIPDFIHPCKVGDDTCLKESTIYALPYFVKGLPELGVPSVDPFNVDKVSIPLPGVKVTFMNGYISGLKKCVLDDIRYDVKKRVFNLEFHGNMSLKGAYTAVGRLLAFNIDGDGDLKIKITNFRIKMSINVAIKPDANGVKHYNIHSYKYTFDHGDKVTFNMTNLFKGNPELSNHVVNVLNENWRIAVSEFGKPIIDYAVDLITRTIEKFFLVVPIEELVDGPIASLS